MADFALIRKRVLDPFEASEVSGDEAVYCRIHAAELAPEIRRNLQRLVNAFPWRRDSATYCHQMVRQSELSSLVFHELAHRGVTDSTGARAVHIPKVGK